MRLDRAVAEAVLRDVIVACDPATRVREALGDPEIAARLAGRRRVAIAIGKAAWAMARGAGEVAEGIAVVPHGAGGPLPSGWRLLEATHPVPDERSVAAGLALQAFVQDLRDTDVVLALLSGGASALAEVPIVALDEFVATIRDVMAAGAPIDEINTVRGALSAIKAGQLALASPAPIITLAVSDVIGDALAVIGSGPTIGPWLGAPGATSDGIAAHRSRARAILARHGVAVPRLLESEPPAPLAAPSGARVDLARVIAPMASAAQAAARALASRGIAATLLEAPIAGEVEAVARGLAILHGTASFIAWGEPTLRVPERHGIGGRAQQLALILARAFRGTARTALVAGTDGIDGPAPPDRPAPAGAWIDGRTWDAIAAAGLDPAAALATCDAGTALAAAGALIVTGPSGINHADLVILGE
ncbi:MAG TPA: glycerate kinase [Kofleriaceae bacterium]|nr:glycerate kinase [Kofleriaceae bacterium]